MPFTLKMPKLSPTMEKGTLAKWYVQEGDFVEVGALLLEVATDKATVEYNAIDSGYIRKILILDKGEASVNEPLAILSENKDEDISNYVPEGVQKPQKPKEAVLAQGQPPPLTPAAAPSEAKVFASPLARVMAKEKGVSLEGVVGTGPRGRVMSRDLVKISHQTPPSLQNPAGSFIKEPLSPIRKVIAQRLQAAKVEIPHFYVKEEVDATDLLHMRLQLKESGLLITINDLLIKASALALKRHPEINSGFDPSDQTILRYQTIDISFAVDIPDGLITPIVFRADQKKVVDISGEIKDLVKKAKIGKLQPQEFQGGSFTVSNLGMFGIPEFSAIINPPQGAILAVGAPLSKPRYIEGTFTKRDILLLTLSVDHRVIDGAQAARFLNTLKNILESPPILLV